MVYFLPVLESFTELSTSAARKLNERQAELAAFLGLEREPLTARLDAVQGRTKLPNVFGRLWPESPDEPQPLLDLLDPVPPEAEFD